MKATKKIVGAACALVAAVALSAGSTFAWFATNNTVTVTGMQVKATVPTSLYIAENYVSSAANVTESKLSLSAQAGSLSPVALSTTDATGDTITAGSDTATAMSGGLRVLKADTYTTEPEQTSSGVVATYAKVGTLTPDMSAATPAATWTAESVEHTQDKYVFSQDMTLANKSESSVDIDSTVTITWADTTNTLAFLRVGFIVGTTDGTTWSYNYYSIENDLVLSGGAITTGTAYVLNAAAEGSTANVTVNFTDLVTGLDADSVCTVTFLAWFDGNDNNCFVANAISVAQMSLALEFEAE